MLSRRIESIVAEYTSSAGRPPVKYTSQTVRRGAQVVQGTEAPERLTEQAPATKAELLAQALGVSDDCVRAKVTQPLGLGRLFLSVRAFDRSVRDCVVQLLVVAGGLARVAGGKLTQGLVELAALADVGVDRDRVAGASVGTGEHLPGCGRELGEARCD